MRPPAVEARDELLSPPAAIPAVAERLLAAVRLRAKPLIVTIYGDSVLHHGGGAWLSSVIRLAAPFGLSERVVRTAVFRLRRDGWLSARKAGRRSFYELTHSARRQFAAAEKRIYAVPQDDWDGRWTIAVLADSLPRADRERFARELRWAGFSAFASNVLAYPAEKIGLLEAAVAESGIGDEVLRLSADTVPGLPPAAVRRIIESSWELQEARAGYRRFIALFAPVLEAVQACPRLEPEPCFVIRTLLIDEYRRVLLKDPSLPLPLLPDNWPGREAALLNRNIYRIIAGAAQAHVRRALAADGLDTPPAQGFHARFGGL